MASITGTVLDQDNRVLANTTVTLIGTAVSQVTLSDANGNFSFSGLADGDYKIAAARKESSQSPQQLVRLASGLDTTGLLLQLDSAIVSSFTDDDRYKKLKYAQYFFLMLVGSFYFFLVAYGVWDINVEKLRNLESARGVITYFVAVTTIAMAALLMLAAIMTGGRDLDKRFALGKEILTLLIGVLGTIIGFYYGATTKSGNSSETTDSSQAAVTVSSIRLNPVEPKIGSPFSVSTILTGGNPPYSYSITAAPSGIVNSILNKLSADGNVSETMTFATTAKPGSATLIIAGRDKKNTLFTNSISIKAIGLSNP